YRSSHTGKECTDTGSFDCDEDASVWDNTTWICRPLRNQELMPVPLFWTGEIWCASANLVYIGSLRRLTTIKRTDISKRHFSRIFSKRYGTARMCPRRPPS